MPPETICFYARTAPCAEVSNFAPCGIEKEGTWWRTVEHWFPASNFHDAAYRECVRLCSKPKDAKTLGLARKLPLREDWEAVKHGIMYRAVRKTFEIHPGPRGILLATGAAEIVENGPMAAASTGWAGS